MLSDALNPPDEKVARKNYWSALSSKKYYKRMLDIKANEEGFNQYARYNDLVWKKKNEQGAFLHLLNTDKYNELDASLSLFDIKTLAGKWGVYNYLNWKQIDKGFAKFHLKYVTENITNKKLSEELPTLL